MTRDLNLAYEGDLDGCVLERIILAVGSPLQVANKFDNHGNVRLKKNLRGYNNASKITPFIVLTDLDRTECAPTKINKWCTFERHRNFLFRIAVRSVEAWLLADREAMAGFLGLSKDKIKPDVEELEDPKRYLLNLAQKSRRKEVRDDLLPTPGRGAKIGPGYNSRLCRFASSEWDPIRASENCDSLARALRALERFRPE